MSCVMCNVLLVHCLGAARMDISCARSLTCELAGFHFLTGDLDSVWLSDPLHFLDHSCDLQVGCESRHIHASSIQHPAPTAQHPTPTFSCRCQSPPIMESRHHMSIPLGTIS